MRTFTPRPPTSSAPGTSSMPTASFWAGWRPRSPRLLRGKHKPILAPHVDTGDHVIIVNAAKLDVSARKADSKQYYRHSGYPGGIRTESLSRLLGRNPEQVVRRGEAACSRRARSAARCCAS